MKVYVAVGSFAYEGDFVGNEDCKIFLSEEKAKEYAKEMFNTRDWDSFMVYEKELVE